MEYDGILVCTIVGENGCCFAVDFFNTKNISFKSIPFTRPVVLLIFSDTIYQVFIVKSTNTYSFCRYANRLSTPKSLLSSGVFEIATRKMLTDIDSVNT